MADLWRAITELSPWETLAVALAIAYLLLAMRENIFCWYCAFSSATIYTVLFWSVNLPMASALNVYYMAMAVYGWYQWKYGGGEHGGVTIRKWPWRYHILALGIIMLIVLLAAQVLSAKTNASSPYLDSFVLTASILTTWMMTQKVLESWLYWIVVDSAAIALYWDKELYLTLVLFVVYIVVSVFAFASWWRHFQSQKNARL